MDVNKLFLNYEMNENVKFRNLNEAIHNILEKKKKNQPIHKWMDQATNWLIQEGVIG